MCVHSAEKPSASAGMKYREIQTKRNETRWTMAMPSLAFCAGVCRNFLSSLIDAHGVVLHSIFFLLTDKHSSWQRSIHSLDISYWVLYRIDHHWEQKELRIKLLLHTSHRISFVACNYRMQHNHYPHIQLTDQDWSHSLDTESYWVLYRIDHHWEQNTWKLNQVNFLASNSFFHQSPHQILSLRVITDDATQSLPSHSINWPRLIS